MTKYQQMAHIKRAVKKTLKDRPGKEKRYVFPHVQKKSAVPSYITDNPYYP